MFQFKGSQSKKLNYVFMFLMFAFILANSVDSDEILQ